MYVPANAPAREQAKSRSTTTRGTEPTQSAASSTRGQGSLLGGDATAPPMAQPPEGTRGVALSDDVALTQVPVGMVNPGLQMKQPAADEAGHGRQRAGLGDSIGASRPTLSLGSLGPDVQQLQRALLALGAHLSPDGRFGPETQDAVVAFQREAGLVVDGVVDVDLWLQVDMHAAARSGSLEAPSLVPAEGGSTTPPSAQRSPGSGGRDSATAGAAGAGAKDEVSVVPSTVSGAAVSVTAALGGEPAAEATGPGEPEVERKPAETEAPSRVEDGAGPGGGGPEGTGGPADEADSGPEGGPSGERGPGGAGGPGGDGETPGEGGDALASATEPGVEKAPLAGVDDALSAVSGEGHSLGERPPAPGAAEAAASTAVTDALGEVPEEGEGEEEGEKKGEGGALGLPEVAAPAPGSPVGGLSTSFKDPAVAAGGEAELSPMLLDAHARNDALLGDFAQAVEERAVAITERGAGYRERVMTAAAAAKATVAGALASQSAAVTARYQAARAGVRAQAAALDAQVSGKFASMIKGFQAKAAAVEASLWETAAQTKATVVALGVAQRAKITEQYAEAARLYRQAGEEGAQEAHRLSEAEARKYESKVTGKKDSFLDGYLTDRRWKARAKAARAVGAEYQKGLRAKAVEVAGQAGANLKHDLSSVQTTVAAASDLIDKQRSGLIQQTKATAEGAVAAATEQQASFSKGIKDASKQACAALDAEEQSALAALQATGAEATAAIDAQAEALAAAVEAALADQAAGLRAALLELQAQLAGAELPEPEALAASLQEVSAAIDAQISEQQAMLEGQLAQAEAGLYSGAGSVVEALTALGEEAGTHADAGLAAATTTFNGVRSSAKTAQASLQARFDKGMAEIEAARSSGFAPVIAQVQTVFTGFIDAMKKGVADNAKGLADALRDAARGDMMKTLREEAEKAAKKEQPAWKSIVAWVLIIAVLIVIALVIGPLVIGACVGAAGAMIGAGAAATIIGTAVGTAIVGAVSSGVVQLLKNWKDGNAWNEGLWEAVAIGAITGALTGGLGGWLGTGAREGWSALTKFAIQTSFEVVVNSSVALYKGELNWTNFAFIVLQSVTTNGLGNSSKFKALDAKVQYGVKVGADMAIDTGKQLVTTGTLNWETSLEAAANSSTTHLGTFKSIEGVQKGFTETGSQWGAGAVNSIKGSGETPAAPTNEQGVPATQTPTESQSSVNAALPEAQALHSSAPVTPDNSGLLALPAPKEQKLLPAPELTPAAIKKPVQAKTLLDEINNGDAGALARLTGLTEEQAQQIILKKPPEGFTTLAKLDDVVPGIGSTLQAQEKTTMVELEDAPKAQQYKQPFLDEVAELRKAPENNGKSDHDLMMQVVMGKGKDFKQNLGGLGEPIPLAALQEQGALSRVVGLSSVWDHGMLDPVHKQRLSDTYGISSGAEFAELVAKTPGVFDKSMLNPNAEISGKNATAWWSPKGESKATTAAELIQELALDPKYYKGGAIRVTVSPEAAHANQFKKPTAFDGMMFGEWVNETSGASFGVTRGGKPEAVAPPVKLSQVTEIEVF